MPDKEIWKDIEGYEGFYQISNIGRVRSIDRMVKGREEFKQLKKGKILKPRPNHRGYLLVILSINHKSHAYQVHRLVAKAFLPNPEKKPQVNHINGIKTDNRIENLEFVSCSENINHALAIGLISSGADSPRAKLSNEQIKRIREEYIPRNREYCARALAEKYGVHIETIKDIINNKRYFDSAYMPKDKADNRGKITSSRIEQIKREYIPYDRSFGTRALAKKFGVSHSTIRSIINKSNNDI